MTVSQEFLLDFHERCHRSLARYVAHCGALSIDDLDRELDGFGYATVRQQLQHAIGAERYWVSVVLGEMDASENPADAASIDALEGFRKATFDTTRAYLSGASTSELATPRPMTTWGDQEAILAPQLVLLRTQTHLFHHMGQIAAMCRLLGHPIPSGFDFPLL